MYAAIHNLLMFTYRGFRYLDKIIGNITKSCGIPWDVRCNISCIDFDSKKKQLVIKIAIPSIDFNTDLFRNLDR